MNGSWRRSSSGCRWKGKGVRRADPALLFGDDRFHDIVDTGRIADLVETHWKALRRKWVRTSVNLEMEMRGGAVARVADRANPLALLHRLARSHRDSGAQMPVSGIFGPPIFLMPDDD